LFNKIDFLKIDISGQEKVLLQNISQKIYDVINKISVKMYNLNDKDKQKTIDFLKSKKFFNFFNVVIPNYPTQLLYFWK
jgi:hypothetical protein